MHVDYSKYPANWNWKPEIRPTIPERAGNCCEFCGLKNYIYILRDKNGKAYTADQFENLSDQEIYELFPGPPKISHKVILTVAHLDHDVNNNDPENLRALCQRCHLVYDAPEKARKRREADGQLEFSL